jgi:hypothetical protein
VFLSNEFTSSYGTIKRKVATYTNILEQGANDIKNEVRAKIKEVKQLAGIALKTDLRKLI